MGSQPSHDVPRARNAAVGVVVVDDEPAVRTLVRTVLGYDPRVTVVGEGEDGLQALRLAQELTPDLMLLDISMPRLDGISAAGRVRVLSPQTCIVMYTAHHDPGLSEQALEAGATGVLSKGHALEVLADDLLDLFASNQKEAHRRAATAADLHRSEELFRLLVEAVEDYAIFMLDPAGVIVSWNSGAERINGYTASEILGRHFRIFYPEEQQRSAYPEFELVQALADGHFEDEGWRVRKDGSLMWASVVITAVHDNAGRHIGFAKVTRDITERRREQQERDRQTEELAAANDYLAGAAKERADFLAVTAHELRTPINVIAGSSATLDRYWQDLADQDREQLLAGISSCAGRMNRLLNDLLTAAKLEAGSMHLELEPVRLAPLLTEAVASARITYGEEAPGLDLPDDIVVPADRVRLAQAVDNLIQNAYRHGKPPVRIAVRTSVDTVEILVQDSGVGLAPDARQRVFDRYVTGGAARTTGLGLYIVRELARAHRGDAWWQADGDDAGFVISLPRAEMQPDDA